MPQLKQTYRLRTSVNKVWQALTDAAVIDQWGAGPATMDAREGGMFSLWGGDVHGITTKIEPQKVLCQDWYGDDNPDRKYEVTFTFGFDDDRGEAVVTVEHTAFDDDIQSMSDGWRDYYFEPIKKLLEQSRESRIMIFLSLAEKVHVTDNVWSFRFKPTKPMTWTAGQYMWVELKHNNPDKEGDRRWFTIASAPYEEMVQITTRITDTTFKQALHALPIGGEIQLVERPDGDFTWQDSELPLIFVAGGIGITAFHSILKQRVHEQKPLNVTLIYGNRDDHVPFKDELKQWTASNPGFKVNYVTGMPLSAQGLAKLEPAISASLVYVSGPEKMVKELGSQLLEYGLPQSQLRLDALPNYNTSNY